MIDNMIEVTGDEFYASVMTRDVHPSPERDVTYWKDRKGALVGVRTYGYVTCPYRATEPERFFVVPELAPAK